MKFDFLAIKQMGLTNLKKNNKTQKKQSEKQNCLKANTKNKFKQASNTKNYNKPQVQKKKLEQNPMLSSQFTAIQNIITNKRKL